MLLLSCVNCCFNGLQYDVVGLSVGYCTEHQRILQAASETTCGKLLRKDLMLPSAQREHDLHAQHYSSSFISSLRARVRVNGESVGDRGDTRALRADPVAEVVGDYGKLPTKIASLAQLKVLHGARAELAFMSLGRGYVRRCVDRGGKWTSGVHLLWWTRERLTTEPVVELGDLRAECPLPLPRQVELAKWALLVLRLIFISDIGYHARATRHRVSSLAVFAEEAASETGTLSVARLLRWIRRHGVTRFDAAFPEAEYERLREDLRSDREHDAS